MTEQVKVSWKLGNVELQYEGNESFLRDELPELFQELLKIYKSSSKNGELEPPAIPTTAENQAVASPNGQKLELSVNNIAANLGYKEGSDLVMAASAYLALGEQKLTFKRKELLDAMKSAKHYYSKNHTRSLTRYIKFLIKSGFLLEHSQEVYAIEGGKLKELRARLAN